LTAVNEPTIPDIVAYLLGLKGPVHNLIYLFSAEGLPHLVRLLQACLKKDDVPAKAPEEGAELVDLLQTAEASS
jgi:hypothetical protein